MGNNVMTEIETIVVRLRREAMDLRHASSKYDPRAAATAGLMTEAADMIEAQARDTARLDWLTEHMVEIDWTMAQGCRCGGCNTFRITAFDARLDDVVIAESESLREAIDQAHAKVLEPPQ